MARRLVLSALLASSVACGGDDGGAAATGDCPSGLEGPELVFVPSPGPTGYCIDATEVTQAQYQAFLDAEPEEVAQPDRCAENPTFQPLADAQCEGAYAPAEVPNHPVSCIDWCDAWSYCEWAGKHLCGRIGGGPLGDSPDVNDASASEWFNACSGLGENDYAYGDSYQLGVCNSGPDTFDYDVPPEAVGSFPDCHGTEPPFDRIVDMSGNVAEWIDACDDGGGVAPYCWEASGGSNSRSLSACAASLFGPWYDSWWFKGFRCCGDPVDAG